MKPIFAALAMVALATSSAGGEADTFAAGIVAAHNAERAALHLPALVWSPVLAAHAKAWVTHIEAKGQPGHSPRESRPGEGENIWAGTPGQYTPAEMVGGWIGEKAFFRNGPFPNVSLPGDARIPGHYTQLVWKNSKQVGCALGKAGPFEVLVCRYSPLGNVPGERPY